MRAAGSVRYRLQRSDAERLPGDLLDHRRRLGLVDFRIACPRGATALHAIADVDVVSGLQEEHLPSRLAVRLAFPGDTSQAATVNEQQRVLRTRRRKLDVLDVHLAGFVVAVGVVGRATAARPLWRRGHRSPAHRHVPATHVHAADFLDRQCGRLVSGRGRATGGRGNENGDADHLQHLAVDAHAVSHSRTSGAERKRDCPQARDACDGSPELGIEKRSTGGRGLEPFRVAAV